mmetsp:Transcript_7041/g.25945  ORF Transcript_7041/g.25945 Transcript_7041/m.25945 type:complete len:104 (+) Transcript_7041:162-473(+)|eukprot:scaffold3283_cov430-Prasinococcus_capsulatus_cf.AAC.2
MNHGISELAREVTSRKLYRDCIRAVGIFYRTQEAKRAAIMREVRGQFDANRNETDPKAIQLQKEAAVRGLSNMMAMEAKRMAEDAQRRGETTRNIFEKKPPGQ